MASKSVFAQVSASLRVLWLLAPTLIFGAILMLLDVDSAFTICEGLGCLLMSSVVSLVSLRVNRRQAAAGVALAFLAPFLSFGLVRFAYWPPRKEFLHALEFVQTGMTSTELRHAMRQFSEGTSWPSFDGGGELVLEGAVVFRAEGQTSDWAVICLDGGVVTRVDFWPD